MYSHYVGISYVGERLDVHTSPYFTIWMQQGQDKTMTRWTKIYFTDFLAEIGGLFTSLMAGASFVMAGYQNFVAQNSMIKHLYGEEQVDEAKQDAGSLQPNVPSPREDLRAKVEKRKEFRANYCVFIMISFFKTLCCCLVPCCKSKCSRRLDGYKKL